ncbi:hypothetical protein F2Q69_00019970 [Brassica cretica]|uniref:Uncharacterized protein n=1 Tax=Brassica cretica TaxID=69181 RepID=A0A8S9QI93_BRACR|nr:hypothetical protein F2Q69_00019970 [Brassica cretica]
MQVFGSDGAMSGMCQTVSPSGACRSSVQTARGVLRSLRVGFLVPVLICSKALVSHGVLHLVVRKSSFCFKRYLFNTIQGGSLLNSGFSFLAVDPLLLMSLVHAARGVVCVKQCLQVARVGLRFRRHGEWYLFNTIQGGSLLNSGFSFLAVDPLLLMYGFLRSYALLRAYQNRENAKIEEKWVALLPTRLITIE